MADDRYNEDLFGDAPEHAERIASTLTLSARSFSSVLRRGLKDALVEGKSLEGVLKRAALSISSRTLNSALAPITGLFGQGGNQLIPGLGSGISGLLGGVVKSAATKAIPFAEGGVIGTPTTFPMAGGRVGLMGEAGREAVLPLARGTDGRLGVALEDGKRAGNGSIVVNIQTQDVESFRRSEAQMTAMLARAVTRGRRGL